MRESETFSRAVALSSRKGLSANFDVSILIQILMFVLPYILEWVSKKREGKARTVMTFVFSRMVAAKLQRTAISNGHSVSRRDCVILAQKSLAELLEMQEDRFKRILKENR